jgi:hypothetical protein
LRLWRREVVLLQRGSPFGLHHLLLLLLLLLQAHSFSPLVLAIRLWLVLATLVRLLASMRVVMMALCRVLTPTQVPEGSGPGPSAVAPRLRLPRLLFVITTVPNTYSLTLTWHSPRPRSPRKNKKEAQ